jgi:hypothetical protein
MEEKKYLTTSEILTSYAGLFSRTTLWRLAKKGVLKPCGRKGERDNIYLKESIENYLSRFSRA